MLSCYERTGDPQFVDEGWQLMLLGDDPAREGWASTLLALSNGALGVRGALEEQATATTFLAHAYEQVQIQYHERFKGFAEFSDSRVPVTEILGLDVLIDEAPVNFRTAKSTTCRTLDLRSGVMRRETQWELADGRILVIEAERLVPFDGRTVMNRRIRANVEGSVTLIPHIAPAPRPSRRSNDPRIGVDLDIGGFVTEQSGPDMVVERLGGSGIGVAAVQRSRECNGWLEVATGLATGIESSEQLAGAATALAESALALGFAVAEAAQRATLDQFWARADIGIDGDARLTSALRLNLFHLFASAGRDGRSSAAAKGLTGEGYEGHYFWDAEAYMLPALCVLAPDIARAMLVYRANTLDAAITNARSLDHERGALYAWRTIAGRECSAHYPSGAAQYHINAAIAFAIGLYVDATGDEQFLVQHGFPVLVEMARLWLDLGDWSAGEFHLRGVTGPDEYTALIDDNWYTNRMAQKHLLQTVAAANRVAELDPGAAVALALTEEELEDFSRAATAMHLPFDFVRGLDAQDASFLSKPEWCLAETPPEKFPLLLHYHPLTLYRHQVAKQADLVLGLVLGGEAIPLDRKQRAFAHYEPLTTHDSTLSASTYAILAAEIGEEKAALGFMDQTAFVDLDDKHGNTDHGVHMAALGGSWMALVWGFAGFRPAGERLAFQPILPKGWRSYRFGLRWHGSEVRVSVTGEEVTYRVVDGPGIALKHYYQEIDLPANGVWTGALAK